MLVFGAIVGLIFTYKKRINLPAALMILLLASSCQKEHEIRFGFNTNFIKNSQGLTIMNVGNSAKSITLTGEVTVNDGEVLVELIDPNGQIAFSEHLISPVILDVNELYQAVSGNWRLKYKSLEGEGSINLHLKANKSSYEK